MKKFLFLFIIFSFLLNGNVNSQCKFKKIKKLTKFAISDNCSVDVDISTKAKLVFSKFSTNGIVSFVKSGNEYYLFFYQVRNYSSRYEILENNSLVIIFDDGEPLSLYPCGNFSGKMVGLSFTTFGIGCFYKIDKNQLQQIADNTCKMIIIHITADHKISGTQIDEDGSSFFEYPILSERYARNAPNAAACILSK
ncbi:MAG: hypothetical protein K8R41_02840 [Bacteroidales bacterium]|nr:hypothetical protein [Bacteroidales bacterium]